MGSGSRVQEGRRIRHLSTCPSPGGSVNRDLSGASIKALRLPGESAHKVLGVGVSKGETLICRISVLLKEHVGVLPSSWDWPPLSFLSPPCLTATPHDQSSAPGDQAGPGTQTHSSTCPQSMPRSMLMFDIRICGTRFTRGIFLGHAGTPGAVAFSPRN